MSTLRRLIQPNGIPTALAVLILHGLLLLTMSVLFWSRLVDDSFVFYRYGTNLVQYGVWNWNATGPHEEAYTSFLYAVLAILPAALHVPPLLFCKLFNLAIMAWLPLRIQLLTGNPLKFLLAVLLVSANPYFAIHTFSGMETTLFVLVLFEMAVAMDRDCRARSASLIGVLVTIALPLVRPEGGAFALIYWGSLLYVSRSRASARAFLAFAGVLLAYLCVSWAYFDQPVPNPFYVKVVAGSGGLAKLAQTVVSMRIYWVAVVFGLLLCRNLHWRLLLGRSCVIALFLYGPADLVMDYANRFRFQVFVPAFLALIYYCEREIAKNELALACVTALLCVSPITKDELSEGLNWQSSTAAQRAVRGIGEALYTQRGLKVMLYEAGAIPFYSNCQCIDAWGLGTRRVTRDHLGFNDILAERPDALVLYRHAHNRDGPADSPDENDKRNAVLATGDYDQVAQVHYVHDLWLMVLVRKDLPEHDAIGTHLAGY